LPSNEFHVVTGAFGFSGQYIAKRLIDAGFQVCTITNSPERANPFEGKIKAHPFNFDNPEKLVHSLQGASVLYNNYWVRFNHPDFSYSEAVENTLKLFDAAKKADIKRVVHISITNPSEESTFEYFRGKAKIERALIESGLSYAILRPAVLFGKRDILINNIAWFLRRFPIFGVFGDGSYRLQPIYVGDMAKIAVECGQTTENCIIDAIGPETFTYRSLVEHISIAIDKRRPIISIPPVIGYCVGSFIGKILKDVPITRDEIEGLMADLLFTNSKPSGETRLSDWIKENSNSLGMRYSSELARRKNRKKNYENL
jgi:NADH dehydrogenase